MTLQELIAIANTGYPDGKVQEAFDCLENQNEKDLGAVLSEVGDALAVFIALELRETYDEESLTGNQMAEAVRVISRAKNELGDVWDALEKKAPWNN